MTIYQGKQIILFGGIVEVTGELNDTFIYDISTNTWEVLEEDNRNASQNGSPKAAILKNEGFKK